MIPKSRLGTSVWLEVLLDKYAGHRPTERLLASWDLLGLGIAPSTVAGGLSADVVAISPRRRRVLVAATDPAGNASGPATARLVDASSGTALWSRSVGVGPVALVSARLDVRSRVRAGCRADVAALRVGDHEQAGGARVLARLLECPQPVGAERLEERELRLHGHGIRSNRVDDPTAETRDRVGGGSAGDVSVSAELDRQQIKTRVEPDDELRALVLDRLGDAIGKSLGR